MRYEFYYMFYQISVIDAPLFFKRLSQPFTTSKLALGLNELFWTEMDYYLQYEFYYTFYQISGIDAPPLFKRLSQLSAMWLCHDSQIGSGTKRTLLESNGLIFGRVSPALDVLVLKEGGVT
jgi:hypothetical protein